MTAYWSAAAGKYWETVGVAPDVEVAPAAALEWVLKDLGIDATNAALLAASHAPTLPFERRSP